MSVLLEPSSELDKYLIGSDNLDSLRCTLPTSTVPNVPLLPNALRPHAIAFRRIPTTLTSVSADRMVTNSLLTIIAIDGSLCTLKILT